MFGIVMIIRMLFICLFMFSSTCLGQSKVKLLVNIETDIYKTVTNKKEIEQMGEGGVFEKLYKKKKNQLGESLNIDRERFINAIISGNNDTLSFKLIEKSTGNVIYQLDSLVVNGNYEIQGKDLNKAISQHLYNSDSCSSWESEFECTLSIIIQKRKKDLIKKTFRIYPIIG